ncbi:MAG: dihydroneopterin aldolase [bacterium]|nr:dihydroneopterin aldolase [bacterium]
MNKQSYIEIKDLSLLCHLGVTDLERAHPQKIYVSLKIYGNFDLPSQSDDIKDTVDYVEVMRAIESLVVEKPFKLIERLANEIKNTVLSVCGERQIEVCLVKPNVLRSAKYASFALV